MLNKFLESASSRYPKDLDKSLIKPLSKTDAGIIEQIIEVLKKTKLTEITALLSQWKYLKDSEIYDQLSDWNLKHPITEEKKEEGVEEKKGKPNPFSLLFKREFIYFKDLRIEIYGIRCYEKNDEYNFVKNEMEYQIIINRLPDTTTVINVTTNKVIKYSDIELRDRDFESLDNYMENFEGIHFINKKNE